MICKNLSKNITLIAVSKGQSIAAIEAIYQQGVHHFGENYLQEALDKIQHLSQDIVWHYLGRIQTKKISEIVEHFSSIHSLDSLEHAKKINAVCQKFGKTIDVFVQVNLDQEPQKGGVLPEALAEFIEELQCYKNIAVQGLMLIPKPASPEETLAKFQQLKALSRRLGIATQGKLSMGMSRDYLLAIQAGATHIRIGEALFGKR